jgi:hypothetical protein
MNTVTDSDSVPELEIPALGPAYEEWRKTGKLATEPQTYEPPKPEVPATEETQSSEEEESAPSTEETAVTSADSATAQPQKKKDAASRLKEVLADQKKLRLEREKDQELIRELTRKLSGPSALQTSQPAPEAAKVETGKPVRPKLTDVDPKTGQPLFKTFTDYELALEKYSDDRDAWLESETFKKVTEHSTKAQKEKETAEAEKVIAELFGKRVNEVRQKHADFDQVALRKDLPVVKGSTVEAYILDSDRGAEVLYFLGQHPEEVTRLTGLIGDLDAQGNFTRIGPGLSALAQARELFKIEQALTPVEKPAPKPPSTARPVTQAPPPPHQVSGKAPASDPVEQAVKEGDFAAFRDAENAKILARRKAARR